MYITINIYYFDLIPISKCSINVQKENIQSKKYENVEEKYGFVNDIFYAKDRNSSGTNIQNIYLV